MDGAIGLFAGMLIGGICGVFTMALMYTAHISDEQMGSGEWPDEQLESAERRTGYGENDEKRND